MENISIKIKVDYKCLQNGFEWNNIPNLAIITGVNGAGKSQLISLFNLNIINNFAEITYANINSPYSFITPIKGRSDLSLAGLETYFNNREKRENNIARFQNQIIETEKTISLFTKKKENSSNKGERADLDVNIQNQKTHINNLKNNIFKESIFEYDQEISFLSKRLKKGISELSIEDIKEHASYIYNNLSEIHDFIRYISEIESEKNELRIKLCKRKDHNKIDELEDRPYISTRINTLFRKFGFDYFSMQEPYGENSSWNNELIFIGKKGEQINYNQLSSGEQMIVKFVIWAMTKDERGRRINTMILDEPDSHLHPKMSQMMIEIFQEISKPIEEGGSGIRIILTTHSPSTVAFAPENSLFVLQKDEQGNREIIPTNNEEAINALSEGIFTFDKAMQSFQLIEESQKSLIVCTEGKTDVKHIQTAIEKLNYDLDIDVIDIHDAGALANFIKSTPAKLFNGKKLVAVFDNDQAGRKPFKKEIEKNSGNFLKLSATQCEGKSYVLHVPPPNEQLKEYCPIEFLYPKSVLEEYNVIAKGDYAEFMSTYKAKSPEENTILSGEFENGTTLRPYKVRDNIKNKFSEEVANLDSSEFEGFRPLLNALKEIKKS